MLAAYFCAKFCSTGLRFKLSGKSVFVPAYCLFFVLQTAFDDSVQMMRIQDKAKEQLMRKPAIDVTVSLQSHIFKKLHLQS